MKQPLYNQRGQLTGMIDDGRLLKSGVELLTVNGDVWIAPLGQFLLHGINLDRGEGKQVALPLQYWTKQDGRQMSMFNG